MADSAKVADMHEARAGKLSDVMVAWQDGLFPHLVPSTLQPLMNKRVFCA